MKYWNKDKRTREKHWHRVERPAGADWNYHSVKHKLQLQESTGKFYLYYGSYYIWFELEQDATWFILGNK